MLKSENTCDVCGSMFSNKSNLTRHIISHNNFLWSILASLHPLDSPLVSDYEVYENELNMRDITYPVSINQIKKKFESQNPSISINVSACEDGEIVPLRITKEKEKLHHVNLLLLKTETTSHYCLIKNLNNFLRSVKKNPNCSLFCHYCLHGFTKETLLKEYLPYCQVHDEQDCFLEFKDYEKTLRVPYVIYADFETLNKPSEEIQVGSITPTQLLQPCSFGDKIISTDPNYVKNTVIYRGPNASQK